MHGHTNIKYLSDSRLVHLTSNQEICENEINNSNSYNYSNTILLSAVLLSAAIMILTTLISMKINEDGEKRSPFECGFDPKKLRTAPILMAFFFS
jgi:NADH:ubiquinone oxidoreductase subunit 3 (subunit A)